MFSLSSAVRKSLEKKRERKQLFVAQNTVVSSFEREKKCNLLQEKMVPCNFSNNICSMKELNLVTNNYL